MSQERQADHPIDPQFTRRWSPRAFTGEAIPEPRLLTILEAARWAPSASNTQSWRFAWVRRDTAGWARVFGTLVPFNQGWCKSAAALVVVMSRTQGVPPGETQPKAIPTHSFDTGAAWMSLALQAMHSGWVAHAMAGYDAAALRAALQLPGDVQLEAVVAIGKQGDKSLLPEGLQQRESPNSRLPLAHLAAEVPGEGAFKLPS